MKHLSPLLLLTSLLALCMAVVPVVVVALDTPPAPTLEELLTLLVVQVGAGGLMGFVLVLGHLGED